MNRDVEKVKGFRDIFAPQSVRREKIRRILEDKAKLFGFMPVETPTIEYDALARGDNETDEAVSDRFKLRDKGNRELGLRFEFTFQLARIFKEIPTIKLPWRRYQFGSVFRDEPLRPDRFREFVQFDVDILGDPSVKTDAECVAFADSVLKELEIEAEIRVNNRKLLNSILEKAEIKDNGLQVLREVDKLDKLSEQDVKKNLSKIISEKQVRDLFALLGKDLEYFMKNGFSGADELKELIELGKIYGFKPKFMPTLMRGFSYYTGNVFEIWGKEKGAALAGGGRYDNKVGKYSDRQIPAVGISFGTLFDLEKPEITDQATQYLIVSLGRDKEALIIANELRGKGESCIIFYGKPSKALEYANSHFIQKVVFVGEKEVKAKKFKVKNMKSGKETTLMFSA